MSEREQETQDEFGALLLDLYRHWYGKEFPAFVSAVEAALKNPQENLDFLERLMESGNVRFLQ